MYSFKKYLLSDYHVQGTEPCVVGQLWGGGQVPALRQLTA